MKTLKKQVVLITTLIFISHVFSFGQGTRYAGPYTPSGPLEYFGDARGNFNDRIISGLSFTGLTGTAIKLWECSNITIKNCKFSKFAFRAISAENAKNLTITDCVFDSIADGIFIGANTANPINNGTNSGIKVINNYFKNIIGGIPGHHAVQFTGVDGGGGNQINYNSFENIHLQSHQDDKINIFGCYGSVNDSIQIIGNWFRGGDYNTANLTQGGITFGDNGGSYIHIKNNIFVNTVTGCIGNAGANHTIVENNIVYQSKETAAPTAQAFIMHNFTDNSDSTDCKENTWRNNRSYSLNSSGVEQSYNELYDYEHNYVGCKMGLQLETNVIDKTLNASILPTKIIGKTQEVTTEIISTSSTSDIKIYPNPASDHITIETAQDLTNGLITVYNIKGQKLIERSIKAGDMELDTHNLAIGIYIMKISSNNQQIEEKKLIIGPK